LRSRIAQLEQKFNIYETSFNAYTSLSKKMKKGRYTLNIPKAKKTLDALRKRHRVSNLNVQISSENNYGTPDPSATVGFSPVFREVKLNFAALSDAHVYAFLDGVKA
jgi:hypothetical protein